jgi:hypothetical protein
LPAAGFVSPSSCPSEVAVCFQCKPSLQFVYSGNGSLTDHPYRKRQFVCCHGLASSVPTKSLLCLMVCSSLPDGSTNLTCAVSVSLLVMQKPQLCACKGSSSPHFFFLSRAPHFLFCRSDSYFLIPYVQYGLTQNSAVGTQFGLKPGSRNVSVR